MVNSISYKPSYHGYNSTQSISANKYKLKAGLEAIRKEEIIKNWKLPQEVYEKKKKLLEALYA